MQHGVISRAQVVAAGLGSSYVERKLRRREWSRVHRGVYVDHTGPLTWAQRAWAAVLFYWPAALGERSAVYPESSPSDDRIHVVVDHARRVRRTSGVKVHRVVHFAERVRWNASPPRLRLEEAVLDMCATAKTEFEALAVVTDVCQQRRTTARRLADALDRRARIRHGAWLRAVLADIATGAQSVLEHAYLNRVERAHRLPRGRRQSRSAGPERAAYHDVEYDDFDLLVELDGRLWHDRLHQRALDMDRDLDAAVDGRTTVRIGWAQTVRFPCRTAGKLARLLRARGWIGAPQPCGPSCPLRGAFAPSSAENAPDRRAS